MPKCTWRNRPGDPEECRVIASVGASMCPRHEFMTELAKQKQLSKEQAKANGASGSLRNRGELIRRGYLAKGYGSCKGCNQQVEWFATPKGHNAPYNLMLHDNSPAVCHFATCTRANSFRRSA